MSYVARAYPETPFVYWRPYLPWALEETEPHGAVTENKFLDAFLSIGLALIGDPAKVCLDLTHHVEPNPPLRFWHERAILGFVQSRLQHFSFFDVKMTDVVRGFSSFTSAVQRSAEKGEPYNSRQMVADLLPVWDSLSLYDPRLCVAERMFALHADTATRDVLGRTPYLRESLNWLAQPENGRRAAQMFVYSRVAPLVRAGWRGDWRWISSVVSALESGGNKRSCAHAVRERLDKFPLQEDMPDMKGLAQSLMGAAGAEALARKQKDYRTRMKLLRRRVPRLVQDYRRLATGAWARHLLTLKK